MNKILLSKTWYVHIVPMFHPQGLSFEDALALVSDAEKLTDEEIADRLERIAEQHKL